MESALRFTLSLFIDGATRVVDAPTQYIVSYTQHVTQLVAPCKCTFRETLLFCLYIYLSLFFLMQQMSSLVLEAMHAHGTSVVMPAVPTEVFREEDGRLRVSWICSDGTSGEDIYNTVLMAIGELFTERLDSPSL